MEKNRNNKNNPFKLAVIGAGARGTYAYAPYGLRFPHKLEIAAVAEPNVFRREKFSDMYGITSENQYDSWEKLFENFHYDAVLIANQDADHFDPIMKAMDMNLAILAEKPLSNDIDEMRILLKKLSEYEKPFMICHVLRYTSFFSQIKKLLSQGRIGDLVAIQHNENVGYFHQAHSFVRGNWNNKDKSSPMILAKCCHDMDMINWLVDEDCLGISSFGSLKHFKEENAPAGATDRCLEGCLAEKECPYSAYRYLDSLKGDQNMAPFSRIVKDSGETDDLRQSLETGPYGRCVYRCDNDVVDHQSVILNFDKGITASLIMSAFTNRTGRTIKLMGTKGEIHGNMEKNEIILNDFSTQSSEKILLEASEQGHGGGDEGMISAFVEQLENPHISELQRSNRCGVLGHLMAFGAEESRVSGKTISMSDFI